MPVYEGCTASILGTQGDSSNYHGQDGFGDVPDPDPPSPELIKSDKAVDALLKAAKEHAGQCTSFIDFHSYLVPMVFSW